MGITVFAKVVCSRQEDRDEEALVFLRGCTMLHSHVGGCAQLPQLFVASMLLLCRYHFLLVCIPWAWDNLTSCCSLRSFIKACASDKLVTGQFHPGLITTHFKSKGTSEMSFVSAKFQTAGLG